MVRKNQGASLLNEMQGFMSEQSDKKDFWALGDRRQKWINTTVLMPEMKWHTRVHK